MKQLINELIQLQDLHFTLQEQQALTAGTHLKDLEKSIAALTCDLPPDIAKTFRGLLDHYATAVVPMSRDICSGCGMTVPTIMAYEVKIGAKLIQCPRCTRILYYSDALPRQLKRISKQHPATPNAGIARFSSSRLMLPRLEAKTRDEALAEMIGLMATEGFVEHPDALIEAAIQREAVVPTAIEHGLAFPHVRGVEGGGLIFSAGLKRSGLHFGAPRNRLTKIVFFIVIPLAASAFYLQLITGLMQSLHETGARAELLDSTTPEEMWATLTRLTRKNIT